MDYTRALSQIHAIHEHLAKGEIYRGYRPLPVALTGVMGLMAAALQPASAADGAGFILYWVGVAALCIGVGGASILRDWLRRADSYHRRRSAKAVGQLLPCIGAGAGLTLVIYTGAPDLWPLLPALWVTLYGLGVFSSRPYLPRESGWIGLYFLGAGPLLFLLSLEGQSLPAGWQVGGIFGLGQLLCSLVLYRNQERLADV